MQENLPLLMTNRETEARRKQRTPCVILSNYLPPVMFRLYPHFQSQKAFRLEFISTMEHWVAWKFLRDRAGGQGWGTRLSPDLRLSEQGRRL